MLGSTASTTFDEVQTELKQVKGPDLLENKDKKVTVKEFKFVDKLKGKLRSRNILPYTKAHIPRISKIVVIWCSTDLNLSSGSLKSLKITTLEHQRPPS